MTVVESETIHATSIAIGGNAVLLRGRSGAGKSDLALRLIDRGAALVSDDYTLVERRANAVFASAPPAIAGQLEVRGIGIMAFDCLSCAPVALVVALDAEVERLPAPAACAIAGMMVPLLSLAAFEASAPIKVELALRRLKSGAT
ncbi:MAG: HPr kinase/phosphorylase [Sphingomonas sp.]